MIRSSLPLLLVVAVMAGTAGALSLAAPAQAQWMPQGNQQFDLAVDQGRLLRLERPAASVFVANPEIADVTVQSPTLIHVHARRSGTTSIYAVDASDRVLLQTRLQVTHDLVGLERDLATVVPGGGIRAQSVEGAIVLTGSVASAAAASSAADLARLYLAEDEQVLNQIGVVAATQVNLRVRIAEMSRDTVKQLGIGLDALANVGGVAFGLMNPTIDGTGFGAAVRSIAGSTDIQVLLDALEQEGLITLLAEPNLTAMSGETASFLAGGEFPIPVARDEDGLSIDFKAYGVGLAFTPTVLDDGRINLFVNPEVSSLTSVGAIRIDSLIIPALSTRRAQTSVELGSGQSLAIAGLIDNRMATDVDEFPGLADLPVLGPLFRSTQFRNQETELVIIVTPYLVQPVPAAQIAVPQAPIRPADDTSRVLAGSTWRENGGPAQPGATALAGPSGFVLD